MRITRTVMAKMAMPYAVTLSMGDGFLEAYAASEARSGDAMQLHPPDGATTRIDFHPGGCMGILPLTQAGSSDLLMIEDFHAIYDCAKSGASLYRSPSQGQDYWLRRRLFDLPFLHRMAFVHPHGVPVLIAAQLCREKSHVDDWSQPGAVYAVTPGLDGKEWVLQKVPVLDGLHRNHGLFVQDVGCGEQVYVAADEGIFLLKQPRPDHAWTAELVLDEPTSDLWMFDLDGDGEQEMLTLQPFHGNLARLYKRTGNGWQPVWEVPGEFGHVVWAGRLRGKSCLLLGWRGGEKSLDLYTLEDAPAWRFRKSSLDANVAPLNISVLHQPDRDLILASHGVTNEVVLYTLS